MIPSFGARLREERERKQVALTAIAEDTKIKVSLLEGLEQDDLSCWPDGLYRRAYVRSYARAIGLDPEPIVREFLETYPEPVELDPADEMPPARNLLTSPIATVSALWRLGAFRASSLSEPKALASEPAASSPVGVTGTSPVSPVVAPVSLVEAPVSQELPLYRESRFPALAELCTRLGRLADRRGLPTLLADATQALDAVGLIVWSWDPSTATLRASLADGYSEATIAQLPDVPADAANAVAAAFRSRNGCMVHGGEGLTGAVAVPLMAPAGCVGVLAVELPDSCEHLESVRDCAAILAAQLVGLVGPVALAEAVA